MRFAILDHDGNVIRSWDTGDLLRDRMMKVVARGFRFLRFRPKLRREIEETVDAIFAEMLHEFGLDVSRRHGEV